MFTQKVTQRYHGQFQVNETCSEFEENCQIVWFCENIALQYVQYVQYACIYSTVYGMELSKYCSLD